MQVAFHMVYQSGYNGTAPGWYVDDVSLLSFGAPVILSSPYNQTLPVGSSTTWSVSVAGDSPLSYQWRFNSNSISGATNSALALTNLQLTNTGYYDVVVTNGSGSTNSTPALLTVVIGFAGTNINVTGAAGSFSNTSGAYSVTGSGIGTDGTADIFYYLYQPLAGDVQIIARLTSVQGGDPSLAEAGLMLRESLDPGSKQISLGLTEGTNVVFRRRLTSNNSTVQNAARGTNYLQGTNYVWLRLARIGDTFVAHTSTNGVDWKYFWFTTVAMSNQVQVGIEVTAHHYGQLTTANFDNVSIGTVTPLTGTWPLPGPQLLQGGQNWSTAEFQRVGGFEFLIGGNVGDYFSVKGTTNLALPFGSWATLGTVTNTFGVVPFVDPHATTNKLQFFRAQRLGP